ncbi:MAG TPA: YqhR family membrane protein [Pseudogracilibacillus sp.]|nr:YqhR family membrane protein [Pseudogracilibacillus sp.]
MEMKKQKDKFIGQAFVVGLIASLISIALGLFFHTFHFIPFSLFAWIKDYFVSVNGLATIILYGVVILLISLISIMLALIYAVILRKKKHWKYGAMYGVLLWFIFYVALPYFLTNILTLTRYEVNVSITIFCFFLLYGVFVGYSISFHDRSVARLK